MIVTYWNDFRYVTQLGKISKTCITLQINNIYRTATKVAIGLLTYVLIPSGSELSAQPVPPDDSNIPFLVTFGNAASNQYGDDDFSQTFFISVPKGMNEPFYIRVFDPDVGGKHDELYGDANTETKFSIYGGKDCYSEPDARSTDPNGNYKSGMLLDSKLFGKNETYDNQWYAFGPFSGTQGEYLEEFDGYAFKIIADGLSGDDGNLYRYFFSKSPSTNIAIEGANAFSYEWTFRMPLAGGAVCHLYPYITEEVVSIKQSNYDWDNDGVIKIVSYEKKGEWVAMSNEQEWKESEHPILEKERNGSLDIQFVRSKVTQKNNNNVCFTLKNQYGEFLRFFSIPIGGVPKFKYDINLLDRMQEGERFNKEKVYRR